MIYTFVCLMCSALYAIVYAAIYFTSYRITFFTSLSITAFMVAVLYFYMNNKKKKGPWDSLGNLAITLILLVVISFIIVLVAGIRASTYLDASGLSFTEWSVIASYVYRISPVILLLLNVANIAILAFHHAIRR